MDKVSLEPLLRVGRRLALQLFEFSYRLECSLTKEIKSAERVASYITVKEKTARNSSSQDKEERRKNYLGERKAFLCSR